MKTETAHEQDQPEGIKSWLDAGLGFLYPNICQTCQSEKATAPEGYVCQSCRSRPDGLRYIEEPFCQRCGLPFAGEITTPFTCANCEEMSLHFKSARASVALTDLMKKVVHGYKYQEAYWYEPFLFEVLFHRALPVLKVSPPDLIVPVPLHPLKKRSRRFNQAERIAAPLARALNVPVNKSLVRRSKPTLTQTHLHRSERAKNVAGAFTFCREQPLSGESILLVDDVLTTGATTSACAHELIKNGAGTVRVWTIARGTLQ